VSLFRTLRRSANTAVKLPFAMAWDVLSLGNMGDGASTSKVLREHCDRKCLDDATEICERLGEIARISREAGDTRGRG
jgi:hypothetical protein